MTDRSEKPAGLLNRRDFMTRAAVAMWAAATLAAVSRTLSLSPFKRNAGNLSSLDSIFIPRPGSRLMYWRNKLNQFRLR